MAESDRPEPTSNISSLQGSSVSNKCPTRIFELCHKKILFPDNGADSLGFGAINIKFLCSSTTWKFYQLQDNFHPQKILHLYHQWSCRLQCSYTDNDRLQNLWKLKVLIWMWRLWCLGLKSVLSNFDNTLTNKQFISRWGSQEGLSQSKYCKVNLNDSMPLNIQAVGSWFSSPVYRWLLPPTSKKVFLVTWHRAHLDHLPRLHCRPFW